MIYIIILFLPIALHFYSLRGSLLLGKIDVRFSQRYNDFANKYPAIFPFILGILVAGWRAAQDLGERPVSIFLLVLSLPVAIAFVANIVLSYWADAAQRGKR